jgi:uracil-DNA glycosylase family 4
MCSGSCPYSLRTGLQASCRASAVALAVAAAAAPAAAATEHPAAHLDCRSVDVTERAAALDAYAAETSACTRCRLAEGRTQVVFGVGSRDADLMFVGEAPGFHEDQQGLPFVGQAGKLLDSLLAGIGLTREDVFIANVLKCRPPGNRDPAPDEIEACERHLFRQIELIEPTVVATLGNFATKLLSGKQTGITRVHGQEQQTHIGGRQVLLYPLYHPAAALYTPAMLQVLQEDFSRLPKLLGSVLQEREVALPPLVAPEPATQLGLF